MHAHPCITSQKLLALNLPPATRPSPTPSTAQKDRRPFSYLVPYIRLATCHWVVTNPTETHNCTTYPLQRARARATMSANATTAEAKKRGQSKKPVPEEAVTRPAIQTKMSSTQKPSVKLVASQAAEREQVQQSKRTPTVAKSSKPTVTTTTMKKKDAPMPQLGRSRILDEVGAKGRPGRIQTIEDEWAAIAAAQKTAAAQVKELTRMRLRSRSAVATTTTTTTTIPLPRVPKPAPSPLSPLPSSNVKPAPPGYHYHYRAPPPPLPPSSPSPSPSPPKPYTSPTRPHARIIEPTPNMDLPPKYRPAARRVTAIIVGLPFVIVMGWELFERWNGKEVKKRFGDGGLPGPKLASRVVE